jgi:hypothetical protein
VRVSSPPVTWAQVISGPVPYIFPASASSVVNSDALVALYMAAGGRDNGAPGIRAHYHPNYYGAFAFDPEGNNVEAVCHKPEP